MRYQRWRRVCPQVLMTTVTLIALADCNVIKSDESEVDAANLELLEVKLGQKGLGMWTSWNGT